MHQKPIMQTNVSERPDQTFAPVVQAQYPALLKLAKRLVGNKTLAEDCVQEAVVFVWQQLTGDTKQQGLQQRLRQAVVTQCARQKNARSRDSFFDTSTEESVSSLEPDYHSLELSVACALKSLPSRYRRLLRLVYEDGLPVERTARILHIHPQVIQRQLEEALGLLRDGCSGMGWV